MPRFLHNTTIRDDCSSPREKFSLVGWLKWAALSLDPTQLQRVNNSVPFLGTHNPELVGILLPASDAMRRDYKWNAWHAAGTVCAFSV